MVRPADKSELLPGTLEMLILQTLKRGEQHGYAIAQHIQSVSDEVLQVEEGSLYPALQRLLMKDWVTASWGTSANNRRARYYRLTTAGRKQLGLRSEAFQNIVAAIRKVMQPA